MGLTAHGWGFTLGAARTFWKQPEGWEHGTVGELNATNYKGGLLLYVNFTSIFILILFTYFWLRWVSVALRALLRLQGAGAVLGCRTQASLAAASLTVEHRL